MKLTLNLNNNELNSLCGPLDEYIILIEKSLDVVITHNFTNFENIISYRLLIIISDNYFTRRRRERKKRFFCHN